MKTYWIILFWLSAGIVLYAQQPTDELLPQNDRELQGPSGVELSGYHHLVKMGGDGSYFYVKTDLDGDFGKVFYRSSLRAEEQLLFDPLMFKNDAFYMVQALYPDPDGLRVAIALGTECSETHEVVVVHKDQRVIGSTLTGITGYGVSWMPDGEHLLYHRFASKDRDDLSLKLKSKTFLHRLGGTQQQDTEFFSARSMPELNIADNEMPVAQYDDVLKAIVGKVIMPDHTMKVYIKRGEALEEGSWTMLADENDQVTDVKFAAKNIYYRTLSDAPNQKILVSNLRWPEISNADLVVPEFEDQRITDFKVNSQGVFIATVDNQNRPVLWLKGKSSDTYNPTSSRHFSRLDLPVKAVNLHLEANNPSSADLWIHIMDEDHITYRYRYLPNGKFVKEPVSCTRENNTL